MGDEPGFRCAATRLESPGSSCVSNFPGEGRRDLAIFAAMSDTATTEMTTDALPLERVIRIAEFRAGLRAFMHRSEEIAQSWELTPQRYSLLLTIKGAPDGRERLSFTEISRRLLLSRNTVTELCQRAEEAGLIRRERSERDHRVIYLRLTDEGDRRLSGAVLESDLLRHELDRTFRRLSASLRATGAQTTAAS